MRALRLLIVLPAALIAAACGPAGPTEPSPPEPQRYLFEVELQNHDPRFPAYWLGLVVEADGTVASYDRGVTPSLPCSHWWQWITVSECTGSLTATQLASRYTARTELMRLSPAEIAARRAQVDRVADGPLRTPNLACNDSGVLGVVAFRYEAGTARYRPVILRLEGDQVRENLSPEAADLAAWLTALAEQIPRVSSWRQWAADCRPLA